MNAYKFRVFTEGLDWKLYFNNPIMLWMHFRASGRDEKEVKPLGNVREIEIDLKTGEVTGRLYFNDLYPYAVEVYNMYENGTMNMLSLGVEPTEWSEDPDQMEPGQLYASITKGIVKEISCVDIGANAEAYGVALYDASGSQISLSDSSAIKNLLTPQIQNSNMKLTTLSAPAILTLLKLSDAATESEAVQAIQKLVTLADTQAGEITTLKSEKKQAEDDLTALKTLSDNEKITTLANSGVGTKYTKDAVPGLIKLATADYDTTKAHIEAMPAFKSLSDSFQDNNERDPELTELCKKTFIELFHLGKAEAVKLGAPDEYKRIYKAHYGRDPK